MNTAWFYSLWLHWPKKIFHLFQVSFSLEGVNDHIYGPWIPSRHSFSFNFLFSHMDQGGYWMFWCWIWSQSSETSHINSPSFLLVLKMRYRFLIMLWWWVYIFITMLNSCSVLVMWKWIILSCVSVLLAFVATRAVSFSHLIFQN